MTLGYTKLTEEQDKLRGLISEGEYVAIIDKAELKTSKQKLDKNGQPLPTFKMLQLDLIIADANGRERKLKDWVMLEGEMAWKFRHLCLALDLGDLYENDLVDIGHLLNKPLTLNITISKGKDNNNVEVMRNNITDYLKIVSSNTEEFIDSDIPL